MLVQAASLGGERRKADRGSQALAQVQPGRSPVASADMVFFSTPCLIPPSLSSHLRNSPLCASGFAGEAAALLHALGGMTHKGELMLAGRPPRNWREPEDMA